MELDSGDRKEVGKIVLMVVVVVLLAFMIREYKRADQETATNIGKVK